MVRFPRVEVVGYRVAGVLDYCLAPRLILPGGRESRCLRQVFSSTSFLTTSFLRLQCTLFHQCNSFQSRRCFTIGICDSLSPLHRASILVSHSALVAGQREMALVSADDQPNQQRDEPVGQHFIAIDWFILLAMDFVPVSNLSTDECFDALTDANGRTRAS